MAFSSVLPFVLPTHSVDCAVHLLLCHSRALLVNSALFLPFTELIMPFSSDQFTALKCPFDGPFTALKCPFQIAPCPFENLGRTLVYARGSKRSHQYALECVTVTVVDSTSHSKPSRSASMRLKKLPCTDKGRRS